MYKYLFDSWHDASNLTCIGNMAFDLKGKPALVTGAGSGICLAFAQKLLKSGCNVVFADLGLRPEAESVVNKFKDGGNKGAFIKTDVTNWIQVKAAFDEAMTTFGRLDIVCPGAGIFEPVKSAAAGCERSWY